MRLSHKLSQSTIAADLGYSNYYIGQVERGNANVTCDVMSAVSGYFHMSIGEFWTFAESLPTKSAAGK